MAARGKESAVIVDRGVCVRRWHWSHIGITLLGALLLAILLGLTLASAALAGGYSTPTAGQSPHGNYANTTDKCKVCHAVHNASTTDSILGGPTETLLRSSRMNSCVYCHIVGAWSITKIYDGQLANYTTDSRYNHDDAHRSQSWGSANYAGCVQCHSVHGANVLAGYEDKIVSSNPGPWLPAPVTSLTDFCRDCHDDHTFPGGPYGGKYGARCGFCHNTMFFNPGGDDVGPEPQVDNVVSYRSQDRNGTTHIMTTTMTGNSGTQVAWTDSSDCRDCHSGGNYTQDNSFPHYTSGAYFLNDGFQPPDEPPGGADSGMDRVCLGCHAEGGDGENYTTGVGKTF